MLDYIYSLLNLKGYKIHQKGIESDLFLLGLPAFFADRKGIDLSGTKQNDPPNPGLTVRAALARLMARHGRSFARVSQDLGTLQ